MQFILTTEVSSEQVSLHLARLMAEHGEDHIEHGAFIPFDTLRNVRDDLIFGAERKCLVCDIHTSNAPVLLALAYLEACKRREVEPFELLQAAATVTIP